MRAFVHFWPAFGPSWVIVRCAGSKPGATAVPRKLARRAPNGAARSARAAL
jgi:hypothetical protein